MTRLIWLAVVGMGCVSVHRIPNPEANEPELRLPPSQAQSNYIRGRLAMLDGDLEVANKALSMARVFDPQSAWIPIAQGEVALVGGDVAGAAKAWEEATRVDPTCSAAWQFRARVERFQGRPAIAAAHYKRARKLGYGWKAWAGEIDSWMQASDRSTAAAVVAEWAQQSGLSATASAERGQRRLRLGDPEGAAADLFPAVQARPEDMGTVRRWVAAVLLLEDAAPALVQVDEIRSLARESKALLWASAVLGDATGDADRTAAALEAWAALDPEDEVLHALRERLSSGDAR